MNDDVRWIFGDLSDVELVDLNVALDRQKEALRKTMEEEGKVDELDYEHFRQRVLEDAVTEIQGKYPVGLSQLLDDMISDLELLRKVRNIGREED